MMIKLKQKQTGFTMIELLIVIVILGILSAIGLRSFTASQVKSRDSYRKSSLDEIAFALETYYNDHGSYPLSSSDGRIIGCGVNGGENCSYGSIWQDTKGTTYMVKLPADPKAYSFFYLSADGSSYQLYARLENSNDIDIPKVSGEAGVYSSVNDKCGGDGCNYGVTSTNITLGTTEAD